MGRRSRLSRPPRTVYFLAESGQSVTRLGLANAVAPAAAGTLQLELVSMATGRLTAVPQTWVSSTALVGFGWAADQDSLVAELAFTTKVQLASWRPGASRLAIAVLRPQHSPVSLVIGQYAR